MGERQTAWLFIFLLIGQLLLLAAQLPNPAGRGSQLEALWLRLVAPPARLVSGTLEGVGGLGGNLRKRSDLQAENEQLRQENQRLLEELRDKAEVEQQLARLAVAHQYQAPPGGRLQVADIVYGDYTSWVRTLLAYAPGGAAQPNQAVVSLNGLVGRVVLVSGAYAKVQLITDRAAGIGAMLEHDRGPSELRERRQGLVRGTPDGDLELVYIPRQFDVRVGDRVITSGLDGVFPRGIDIGAVTSVNAGDDLFYEIRLRPAADFGTLDHVYIVIRDGVPSEIRDQLPGD